MNFWHLSTVHYCSIELVLILFQIRTRIFSIYRNIRCLFHEYTRLTTRSRLNSRWSIPVDPNGEVNLCVKRVPREAGRDRCSLKSKRVCGAGRWLAKTIISAEIVQYCIEQRLGSRTSSWHRPDTCMLHTDCHINTRKKPHIKRKLTLEYYC